MTVQSSFLIRCYLPASTHLVSGGVYHVEHVQTGSEFRASSLAEVSDWIRDLNLRYLADSLGSTRAGEDNL